MSAPPAGAPTALGPKDDLVTLCQLELDELSRLLFTSIGELNQNAPPVSVSADQPEPIVATAPNPGYDPHARAQTFAADLVTHTKRLGSLVQRLPPPQDEMQQYGRIQALMQRSQELSEELDRVKAVAEAKLNQAQDLYAALAKHKLQHPNT